MSSSPVSKPVDLRGRRIFMTGGTGVLGKSWLDYFAESMLKSPGDLAVTVLSRSPGEFLRRWPQYRNLGWLKFVQGDLDHLPEINSCTDVIHAAADTHGVADKAEWSRQIVEGTRAVLDWAVESGARRFLLTSSGAIYGPQPATLDRLSEDHTLAPSPTLVSSVYGQSKRMAEQLCAIYAEHHPIEPVIGRCFALVSPHLPLDGPYAIGNFIRDALWRDNVRVRGDGRAVRTYLDGRDMVHWLTTLLKTGKAGEAYNVGSDQDVTMAELAQQVVELVSPGKPVVIEGALADDGSRSRYVPDIRKAASLGLRVETTQAAAILSTTAAACLAGPAPRI